jgi:hypothetical protein
VAALRVHRLSLARRTGCTARDAETCVDGQLPDRERQIVEHWDIYQPIPPVTKSGNPRSDQGRVSKGAGIAPASDLAAGFWWGFRGCPLRDSWLGLLATHSAPILTAAKENVDTCAQPVVHVLRSDCQQISAHPSERNASWMSARLSYRTRKRRN